VIVSVATLVASLDLFIVNIAFPSIKHDFAGTSDATLSWVLSAYAIVMAALLVPAGRLADLLGRKRLFMGGLIMFPISLFTLHGLHPSTASIVGWLYLVTFGSIVGYTAYTWLLANAPLGMVSTYAYVNPVVAITLGVLFRGEHLTWRLLIGATIIVIAVATVVRREPLTATVREEGVR
jgi:drug/metabolite transporter (DMT)-like permease